MKNKHYLSIYYGIDENLPDDEFYQKINEINQECEEAAQKYNSPCDEQGEERK